MAHENIVWTKTSGKLILNVLGLKILISLSLDFVRKPKTLTVRFLPRREAKLWQE